MLAYADTSALISYYLLDRHSAAATAAIGALMGPLAFTALHRLELRAGMMRWVFQGRLTAGHVTAAWENVIEDVRRRRLRRAPLSWQLAFREAAALANRHGATLGVRSLDILHAASAHLLGAREFVSFDLKQRGLASAMGLSVLPPQI